MEFDHSNLKIEGYNVARSDHPSTSRGGCASISNKQSLASKILDFKYLKECIVFQILIGNELCNHISLYRSPSQPSDISDQSADNAELTLDEVAKNKPFLIVALGDLISKLVQT